MAGVIFYISFTQIPVFNFCGYDPFKCFLYMNKFYALPLALCLILLIACKPRPVEILSRKWKPVDITGEGITPGMRENILREGYLMEFTKDGRFMSYAADEATETGSYTLSEDGKTILLTTNGNMEVEMKVRELKQIRLVVESNGLTRSFEPAQ